MSSTSTTIHTTACWICGKEVSLRNCKVDERGRAVHEECYIARTKLEAESKKTASNSVT
jgi:hypothetical protein